MTNDRITMQLPAQLAMANGPSDFTYTPPDALQALLRAMVDIGYGPIDFGEVTEQWVSFEFQRVGQARAEAMLESFCDEYGRPGL